MYDDSYSLSTNITITIAIHLVNVTLTTKSALHISQFVRHKAAALYHIAIGIEKYDREQRIENRQRTENRETNY